MQILILVDTLLLTLISLEPHPSCALNYSCAHSLEFEDLPPVNAETSAKANADLFERHWRAEVDTNPADPSFFRVARAMFGTQAFIAGALNGVANGIQARV